MLHEITGFGPLEPLLKDPTITEVMVNGPDHIYIERAGKILGLGIANLVNLFNPKMIIISGEGTREGDFLFPATLTPDSVGSPRASYARSPSPKQKLPDNHDCRMYTQLPQTDRRTCDRFQQQRHQLHATTYRRELCRRRRLCRVSRR